MLLFAIATLICLIVYGVRTTSWLLFAVGGFSITAASIAMAFGTGNTAGAAVVLGGIVVGLARWLSKKDEELVVRRPGRPALAVERGAD